ncbi:MAG: helix-turn-helix domain-containing protein, partial [Dehalococcoidia bacterium]
ASAGTEASGKLNHKAVEVMKEIGIDISHHTSDQVDMYMDKEWSKAYLSQIETGKRIGTTDVLTNIAKSLGLTLDDILS